jgi:hypothetical protein
MDLGMGFARAVMISFTDDFPVFNNDTAHVGIRVGRETSTRGQLQRSRHVQLILHGLIL